MLPVKTDSVYFKGFNGIRFIAAFAVIIHHIEEYKSVFFLGIDNLNDRPVIYQLGKFGVALFFVLSGFLITYLLLAEKQKTGTVDIAKFYIRRMLRIWPLYFLIVLLSFFVFPTIGLLQMPIWSETTFHHFYEKLTLYLLVLPNLVSGLYEPMPLSGHVWSIGVEEQFYLFWPWLVLSRHFKKTLIIIGAIGLVLAGVFFYYRFILNPYHLAKEQTHPVLFFVSMFMAQFRIGCMAIGGLGAYLVFKNHPILEILHRKSVQIIMYLFLIAFIATGFRVPGINYEFYAVLFCFLLINLASNPQSVVQFENPLMKFMGSISYGLYIYHPVAITLVLNLLAGRRDNPGLLHSFLFNLQAYALIILLTILLAYLSYTYFEKPFLRLKDRFMAGASTDRRATVSTFEVPVIK
ncbi:acyltransferase [Larkinella sp. C7]|uniref:acyltransferase family protein n=1 Tax=Larkinella sp. C7 TaxID=2576607 RepID=UPI00111122D2|nr:acyltransferase [Larkinella sp. C7]